MEDAAILEAREKLKQKFASSGRIGGKGSVRRKKKTATKAASADDKKLNTTLKRLGVNSIPGIEEVNIFKDDGSVIHFQNPKLQASIGANTYVVSGNAQNKTMADMLPSMLSSAAGLKQLQEAMAKGGKGGGLESLLAGLTAGGAGDNAPPELEEETADFEKVAAGSS